MKKAVNGIPDRRNSLSKSLEACGSVQYAGTRGKPGPQAEAGVSIPQRFQGSAKNLGLDL